MSKQRGDWRLEHLGCRGGRRALGRRGRGGEELVGGGWGARGAQSGCSLATGRDQHKAVAHQGVRPGRGGPACPWGGAGSHTGGGRAGGRALGRGPGRVLRFGEGRAHSLSGCPPDFQPPPCQRAPSCPLSAGTPGRRASRSAVLPRGALRTGGEAPPRPRLSRLRPQTWWGGPARLPRAVPRVRCAHLAPWPRPSRPGVCKPSGLSAQPPRARPAFSLPSSPRSSPAGRWLCI